MIFFKVRQLACWLTITIPSLTHAEERPNILWITTEDNSSYWLGCYGNPEAQTPHLDALSERSITFTSAYSNAPVCAVARSTILMGRYAPSMGTQHMRSRYQIPTTLTPYVTHLRKAGYYCSNSSKTDYNFEGNDKSLWDDCSKKAHYKNRPENAPFFAIFNLTTSHESSLFPEKLTKTRSKGTIPSKTRLNPAPLTLPAHLPDLPECRSDVATYHDIITATDTRVGEILDQLKSDGLAENTIIFYYGDHGGATPRGKRYLYDTGVRIPMIIHVPEKWAHLAPSSLGKKTDEIISFVDLAPTLLSLTECPADPNMQGRAILGKDRTDPPAQHYAYLYADRFDEITGLRRGLTDGRYKYIRNFTPHLWGAPASFYQMSQPAWQAWHRAWQEGTLSGTHAKLWESDQANEEFYDTQNDPWEIHNLAQDPAHQARLAEMRAALKKQMAHTKDTGIIPEPLFDTIRNKSTLADTISKKTYPHQNILDLAFLASDQDVKNLAKLRTAALSEDPVTAFWGLQGLAVLGKESAPARDELLPLLESKNRFTQALAAQALYRLGETEKSRATLVALLTENPQLDIIDAFVANTCIQLRQAELIPESWVKSATQLRKNQPRIGTIAINLDMFRAPKKEED